MKRLSRLFKTVLNAASFAKATPHPYAAMGGRDPIFQFPNRPKPPVAPLSPGSEAALLTHLAAGSLRVRGCIGAEVHDWRLDGMSPYGDEVWFCAQCGNSELVYSVETI